MGDAVMVGCLLAVVSLFAFGHWLIALPVAALALILVVAWPA